MLQYISSKLDYYSSSDKNVIKLLSDIHERPSYMSINMHEPTIGFYETSIKTSINVDLFFLLTLKGTQCLCSTTGIFLN